MEIPVKKDGTPYVRMSGATLYKYMKSWQYKHNIEFVFCHKNGTPGKILELLEVDKMQQINIKHYTAEEYQFSEEPYEFYFRCPTFSAAPALTLWRITQKGLQNNEF